MSQHSWSTVERGNPPPRRKSCAACIKAKRRCTLDSPSCLRCTQRLIECRYPDTPAPRRRPPRSRFAEKEPATFSTPAPSIEPHLVHPDPSPDPSALPDVPLEYLTIAQDTVGFATNTTPDFFNQPPPPQNPDPNRIYHALPIITPRHDPPPRTPPTTVATRLDLNPVLHAITARLQFSMDKLFASVNQMVLECGTPWCHPSIYQNHMPKVLEDALTSCALYTAKNPLNAPLILRTISTRGNALLATPLPTTSGPAILAHVHALLLYQIIRTFDGDPSLLATAEAGVLPLMDAAFALMPFLRFDKGTFEPYGLETPEPVSTAERAALADIIAQRAPLPDDGGTVFWETWALEESMRRTFVMALFFVRVYQLVWPQVDGSVAARAGESTPEQMCDGKLGLCHSYTVSGHLWRARDAGEFAERWRTKGHFVVRNTDFKEVMMNAGADDIDDFTKILLCALLGKDAVAKWFVDRGGCLE